MNNSTWCFILLVSMLSLHFKGCSCLVPRSSLSSYTVKPQPFYAVKKGANDDSSTLTTPTLQELRERRSFLQISISAFSLAMYPKMTLAAPPIAIIAEEMGYFPVTNKGGDTVYIPAKIKRSSTDQAIALANHLKSRGSVMYGAYWCPHCQHQKELFGKEAWALIDYVECSPKGYYYDKDRVGQVANRLAESNGG